MTQVTQSMTKLEHNVNFFKGRTNKLRREYVFYGATPRIGFWLLLISVLPMVL